MVASSLRADVPPDLPRHVAIIMDGNGRWAELRGLSRTAGHEGGIEPVREAVRSCAESGIKALSLFAFSSENFNRPPSEIGSLMALFVQALEQEIEELDANGVRVRFIGNRRLLDPVLVRATQQAERRTAGNPGLVLSIAVAYGGHWDIVQAAQQLAMQVRAGALEPESITESLFADHLCTAGLPAVDLLIRTGGEQRISNFMLWDLAYSELYFSQSLWPDFDRQELQRAFAYYASRQRRFGKTGQQLGIGAC